MKTFHIALVGVNTLLGREVLKLLSGQKFPVGVLRPLVVSSVGERKVEFNEADYVVDVVSEQSFKGMDMAFFLDREKSILQYAEHSIKFGNFIIDGSFAFNLNPEVPLIVPEVNEELVATAANLVANPSAGAVLLSLLLKPVFNRVGIKRIVATLFYSPACESPEAVKEMRLQTKDMLSGEKPKDDLLTKILAFNVIPQVGSFHESGWTYDEMQCAQELKRIINDVNVEISVTFVRAPLFRGICGSVHVETKKKMTRDEARTALSFAPGICVLDAPEELAFPVPLGIEEKSDVFVGRIREGKFSESTLELWFVADNLRKPGPLNVVQIAEAVSKVLIRKGGKPE